jgi:hypothetical protein
MASNAAASNAAAAAASAAAPGNEANNDAAISAMHLANYQSALQIASQYEEQPSDSAQALAEMGGMGSKKSNHPELFKKGEIVVLSDGTNTLSVPVEILINYIVKLKDNVTKSVLYSMIKSNNQEKFKSLNLAAGSTNTGKKPDKILSEIGALMASSVHAPPLQSRISIERVPLYESLTPDILFNTPIYKLPAIVLHMLQGVVNVSAKNSESITKASTFKNVELNKLIQGLVEDIESKPQVKKLEGNDLLLYNMLESIHSFHMFGIDAPHDFTYTVHELLEYVTPLYETILQSGCLLTAKEVSEILDSHNLRATDILGRARNTGNLCTTLNVRGLQCKLNTSNASTNSVVLIYPNNLRVIALSDENNKILEEMKANTKYTSLKNWHDENKKKIRDSIFTRNNNVCQTACHVEAAILTDECIEYERKMFGNVSDRVLSSELENKDQFNTREMRVRELAKFLILYEKVDYVFVESCMSSFMRSAIIRREGGKDIRTLKNVVMIEHIDKEANRVLDAVAKELGGERDIGALPLKKNISLGIKKIDAGCGCGSISGMSYSAAAHNMTIYNHSSSSNTKCRISQEITGRINSNILHVKTIPVSLAGGVFYCEVSNDYKVVTCTSVDGSRLVYFGEEPFSVDSIQAMLKQPLLRGKDEKKVKQLTNFAWIFPSGLTKEVMKRIQECMLKALKSLTDYIQLTTIQQLEREDKSIVTAISDNICCTMARALALRNVAFERSGSITCNSFKLHGDLERILKTRNARIGVLVSIFDNLSKITERIVKWKEDTTRTFKLVYTHTPDPVLCFATMASFEKIGNSIVRLEKVTDEMKELGTMLSAALQSKSVAEQFKIKCLAMLPAMTSVEHFIDNIIGQNELYESFSEALREGGVQRINVESFFTKKDSTPFELLNIFHNAYQYILNNSTSLHREDSELMEAMTLCSIVVFGLNRSDYSVIHTKCLQILIALLKPNYLDDNICMSRSHRDPKIKFEVANNMRNNFEKLYDNIRTDFQNENGKMCLRYIIVIFIIVNGLESNNEPFKFTNNEILTSNNLVKKNTQTITNWLQIINSTKLHLNETEDNSFMCIIYKLIGRQMVHNNTTPASSSSASSSNASANTQMSVSNQEKPSAAASSSSASAERPPSPSVLGRRNSSKAFPSKSGNINGSAASVSTSMHTNNNTNSQTKRPKVGGTKKRKRQTHKRQLRKCKTRNRKARKTRKN